MHIFVTADRVGTIGVITEHLHNRFDIELSDIWLGSSANAIKPHVRISYLEL